MKLIKFALYIALFFLPFSCNKTTGPVLPNVTTTEAELANFQVIIADYDSVVFKSNTDLLLEDKDIKGILLGSIVNDVFEPEQAIAPVFFNAGDKYKLGFEIPAKVDKEIYHKNYVIRFKMTDDSYIDINAPVDFYKYPYENAEIFLTKEEVESFTDRCQDIAVKESKLYFFGGGGGWPGEYDLTSKTKMLYPDYGGGDFITTNNSYAFYNGGPIQIVKYNFEEGILDSVFIIADIETALNKSLFVAGLTIEDDVLYVLLVENETGHPYLIKFEDGFSNIITTDLGTENTGWPYFLSHNNNIFYCYDYKTFVINRYDLSADSFLTPIKSPTLDLTGMDFYGGRFYYSDWNRIAIFSIPVSDLMD